MHDSLPPSACLPWPSSLPLLPTLCQPIATAAALQEVVLAAYLERTDLSAHGFYSTPDVTGFGGNFPFNYLCYGGWTTCARS